MACVLQVYGRHLHAQAVIQAFNLVPYRTQEGNQSDTPTCLFYEVTTEQDWSFAEEVREIEKFLDLNADQIDLCRSNPDVEGMTLDIAVHQKYDNVATFLRVPHVFIKKLANTQITLELSLYRTSD